MSPIRGFKNVGLSFIKVLFFSLLCSLSISPSLSTDDTPPQREHPKKSLSKDHLSTIKEESSERIIGLLKIPDAKKEKMHDIKLGDYFLKISKSIQKIKEKNYGDLSKMIIYSYPLFTNEEALFNYLITKKKELPSFISVFLRQLILEALPNGIDNFRAAETSFMNLKDGLVDDPFFNCLLKNSIDYRPLVIPALPKPLPTAGEEEWFQKWPIDRFVYVLTQRDINMFCAISFKDLRANLEHPSLPPSSISAITKQFDRTVNWICFEILERNEPREKTKMIQLFRLIGRMLHNNKNYHGAMQVALAFSKMQVSRILTSKEIEEINREKFVKDLTPENNYRNYRELINYPSSKSPELLLLPVFFKDLLVAHEMKSLDEIAVMMENFYRTQTFLNPSPPYNENDRDALKFVSHFADIHDATLDEMSSLIKEWHFPRDKSLPPALEDWTLSHFYTFLEKHDAKSNVCSIIAKNIYNGQDLVAYLKSCTSLEEIGINMTQIGFTPDLRKCLFDHIKKESSDFIDIPVLGISNSSSEILDSKRELGTTSQEEKFPQ